MLIQNVKMMKTTAILLVSMSISVLVFGQNPVDKVIQLTTTVNESQNEISLKWNQVQGNFDIEIYRKNSSCDTWGKAIAKLPARSVEFTDIITAGNVYEYAVKAKYMIPVETYVTAIS